MRSKILLAAAAGLLVLSGCASGHNKFVYTVGPSANTVFSFTENRDGSLTAVTSNTSTGSTPVSAIMHPSGNFFYVANFNGNSVVLFDANRSSGVLSTPPTTNPLPPVPPENFFLVGQNPVALGMTADGQFLYVLNQGSSTVPNSSTISAFRISGVDGTLSVVNNSGSTFLTPANPVAIAVSPKGGLLYVANPTLGSISPFTIGTDGSLTAGAAIPIGTNPTALTFDATGKFLYVADPPNNDILGFTVGTNGALSPISGSPFAAGVQPVALASDPAGAFLFAANNGNNSVSGYVIDKASGALGAMSGSPFATGGRGPSTVAVDATSSVVYVGDAITNDIAAFVIQKSGTLLPVPNSPFGVATSPSSLVTVQD